MATKQEAAAILGLFLAVLVGLFLHWTGATGYVFWVPTIGAFFVGAFGTIKECPYCKQIIFREASKCSECTANLKQKYKDYYS